MPSPKLRQQKYRDALLPFKNHPVYLRAMDTNRTGPDRTGAWSPLMAETHFLMDRSNNHRCLWCNDPYPYRNTGGKPQRFCSAPCRLEFHKATRKWAIEAIERGELTVDQIRKAPGATYTLDTERSRVVRHLGGTRNQERTLCGVLPQQPGKARFRARPADGTETRAADEIHTRAHQPHL